MSESPADEAAIEVLVEAVVAGPVQFRGPGLRARGWPSVAQILPAVIRHLHFNTDVDVLVVVADVDDSVVHTEVHEREGYFHPQCRLCQLRAVFRQTAKRLPPAQGRTKVLRGIGVAVPAIEAWYLCGQQPEVSEEIWLQGQVSGQLPYTRKELKARVYGTERPSLALEIDKALVQVRRLAKNPRRLAHDFPCFGWLARDLHVANEVLATSTP